jgi:hypothetical protein
MHVYACLWECVFAVLFAIASVLAGVALLSSIVLLYMSLDSWNPGSCKFL